MPMSAESASTQTTNSSIDTSNDRHRNLQIQILSNDAMLEPHYSSHDGINIPHQHEKGDVKKRFKECDKRCVPRVKMFWSFVSFLISVADVTVIIYLSYSHFHHSQDMMAWLMLLPILLNFIGIFTFLSK